MKKLLTIILAYLAIIQAKALDIRDSISPNVESTLWQGWQAIDWKTTMLDWVLKFATDSIFGLLLTAAIAVFVIIWAKLLFALWNPEEFKKSLMWFVYAIIWIAIIPMAWWIVALVTSVNF